MKNFSIILLLLLLISCVPSPNTIPTDTPIILLLTETSSPKPIPQAVFTSTSVPIPSPNVRPYPTLDFQTYDLKWCISDAANDVSVSYIDVVKIEAIARGPTFIAKFYLQSIPDVLVFNREGVPSDSLEYSWEILIDVDGDAETNAIDYQYFTDYRLSANHFVLIANEVKTDPIPLGTLQALWKHFPEEQRWKKDDVATIEIDIAAKTITLAAIIVDLNPSTKITFSTFDYNPGHEQQKDKPDFIPMVPPNTACS